MIFSISIPVYNQAEYLQTALESIRCQDVDIQLAVLDASPDDSSQKILTPYRHMIHYAYHHSDAGQTAAVQEGWGNTSGDIVAWLNADDYYFPGALAKVRQVLVDRPDIDVVYGHGVQVSTNGNFEMYFPAISENPALLKRGCIICQPSCFIRRTAMQRVGGLNVALHYAMDWDLWLRLLYAGCSFYFLDEILSAARIYSTTKTLSGAKQRYQEIRGILKTNSDWLHGNASLLAFFHYDLANRTRSFPDEALFWGLNGLSQLHKLLKKPTRTSVRGLQCWTNAVEEACEVCLPWYSPAPLRIASLFTDRPVQLLAALNEKTTVLERRGTIAETFLGRRLKAHVYLLHLPHTSSKLLTFQLRSHDGPWRLLSLKVR